MLRQLTLFQQAGRRRATAPHVAGSATSTAAGQAIRSDAPRLRQAIFAFLLGRGAMGATDAEVQCELGISGDTERPRRGELLHDGLIRDSGTTRKTAAGRLAVVWVAATQGGQPDGGSNAAGIS